MAFESLSEKLNAAFKKLRGKGRLTANDVKEAMREVRLALLEADVSYKVVKDVVHTTYLIIYFLSICSTAYKVKYWI